LFSAEQEQLLAMKLLVRNNKCWDYVTNQSAYLPVRVRTQTGRQIIDAIQAAVDWNSVIPARASP
jgi:hypothetical protein